MAKISMRKWQMAIINKEMAVMRKREGREEKPLVSTACVGWRS